MQKINIDEFKISASQLGDIMPAENARVLFTSTQTDKLIEAYNYQFFRRREDINSKYPTKGNWREEDSITLLSLQTKKMYLKNSVRIIDEYFSGEWDLSEVENDHIIHTLDIKSSYSKNTFDKSRLKELSTSYIWQGQIYMHLTGARKHSVCFCLVNGTIEQITRELNRLRYQHGMIDQHGNWTDLGRKKARQVERNHIFDMAGFIKEYPFYDVVHTPEEWQYDIEASKRVHIKTFVYDASLIESAKARVIECRNELKKL